MKNKIEIPDSIVIPEPPDNLLEKDRDKWIAKRNTTKKMQEMIELLVTSDPSIDALNELTQTLQASIGSLSQSPRYYGKMDYFDKGDFESFGNVSNELSPLSGTCNPLAPPFNIEIKNGEATATVFCGWAYEGPPGTVHGGYVAAIFDHFLGMAQMLGKQPGMTGRLMVRYHARSPLNKTLKLRAWLERVDGRKTIMHAEMHDGEAKTASCEGLFIAPKDGIYSLRPLGEKPE